MDTLVYLNDACDSEGLVVGTKKRRRGGGEKEVAAEGTPGGGSTALRKV
jgi:hypothetical protein